MANFEIAKNGIWKNFFHEIDSRILLAWTFLNFLAHCEKVGENFVLISIFFSRIFRSCLSKIGRTLQDRDVQDTKFVLFFQKIREINGYFTYIIKVMKKSHVGNGITHV